jgi:hypothetical protein
MVSRSGRWLMALASGLLAGCYTYSYVPEMPAPGTRLSVGLTDAGRVQLENSVGPEVAEIEGDLATTSDTAVTLLVARTKGLRGGVQQWAGEPVTLRTGQYRMVRERRFSAPRTVALVGSMAAGFVAFVATRGLLGFGGGGTSGGEGPLPNDQ